MQKVIEGTRPFEKTIYPHIQILCISIFMARSFACDQNKLEQARIGTSQKLCPTTLAISFPFLHITRYLKVPIESSDVECQRSAQTVLDQRNDFL